MSAKLYVVLCYNCVPEKTVRHAPVGLDTDKPGTPAWTHITPPIEACVHASTAHAARKDAPEGLDTDRPGPALSDHVGESGMDRMESRRPPGAGAMPREAGSGGGAGGSGGDGGGGIVCAGRLGRRAVSAKNEAEGGRRRASLLYWKGNGRGVSPRSATSWRKEPRKRQPGASHACCGTRDVGRLQGYQLHVWL